MSLGLGVALAAPAMAQMPSADEMREMQQQMQDGMRMMQEELGKLDPEARKQIEKFMTTKPPASGGSTDGVPARDTGKLANISNTPLSSPALKAHVLSLQPKLAAALSPTARERADKIDGELRKASDYLSRLRAAANGLAAWGAWPEATYLMGKVAAQSGTAQDLSNFAAMLTMQNAPAAALPILITLNARYPNNSTILNNMGQARFGLGDIAEAEKVLTAAVKITPAHPQANMTIARIEMDRGNNQAAEAAIHKAMEGGYSPAKEELLRKAGGKIRPEDVKWKRPIPRDPLGLEKFSAPPYPTKAMDLPAAVPQWQAFNAALRATQKALNDRSGQITRNEVQTQGAMISAALASAKSSLTQQAGKNLQFETEQYTRNHERITTAIADAMKADGVARDVLTKAVTAIDAAGEEKYRNVPGGYGYEYTCNQVMPEIDRYYVTTSPVYEELLQELYSVNRRYLNDVAYFAQYTTPTPGMFEAAKLAAKASFLQLLEGPRVSLLEGYLTTRAVCFQPKPADIRGLPDFDDIHCETISTMTMPGMGSIIATCKETIAKLDPVFAPFAASWAVDVETDRLSRASAAVTIDAVTIGGHSEFDAQGLASGGLSVGVTAGLGGVKGGPLEIGTELGVTAGLEFDRSGLTEVSVDAGVVSSANGVSVGANSTWSWNAGSGGGVSGHIDSSAL